MAASITSRSGIVGIENAVTTWGSAVAPTTLDQVLVESIGPLIDPSEVIPDPSAGYAWVQYLDKCRKNVAPEVNAILRYSTRLWSLVAQCMGLDTPGGASDPYSHVLTLKDAIDGTDLFSTIAGQLGPASGELLFEWPSVKPVGFTIEGPNGQGYMGLSVRTIADTLKLGADCTTSTANIDALTHMASNAVLSPPVPFGGGRLRLNWAAGALSASDNLAIKRFAFTFNRGFDREWASRNAYANEWETAEPIESGIPEQSLVIELGDLNALTYLEAFQDETTCKAEFYLQLDTNHDIKFEFPLLRVFNAEASVSGPNRIPQTLTLLPMLSAGQPTGMAFNNWQITVRDANSVTYS